MKTGKLPKILAIYLPQFYENEDNNAWWGEGFTDWVSVKTAEPYFPGHNEPRIPAGGVYYDLSKKETMQRQAALAAAHGIDGFCFYHYYFKDGKKELELPAENLLRWKDIDMPFCFNWASEPWIRSWSRISGNVWAEKYEAGGADAPGGVLAEQAYGARADWERHFAYLLPFFEDARYIKEEGKPVFVFYSPDDIQPLREMTACWRALAEQAGLPGLYLIGARMQAPNDCLDAALIYEPRSSFNRMNRAGRATIRNGVRCFDYRDAWDAALASEPLPGCRTYFCGISGYDDTPRRGRSGECLTDASPQIFRENLAKLIRKSADCGNGYLFLNAWNEWGEGMYLEPDETDGYGYLEAVRDAVADAAAAPASVPDTDCTRVTAETVREMTALADEARKFRRLFQTVDTWLFLEQERKTGFAAFLDAERVDSVAIYGMASLGKHLLLSLAREGRPAAFGIDRYVGQFGSDFVIYRPEDSFPAVDAIVITAYDAAGIERMLRQKYQGKIYSLEAILDTMMRG